FQAEDGIRDFHVTGVQTCALPIWLARERYEREQRLKRIACIDQLTGSLNRRGLLSAIKESNDVALRLHIPSALMTIDIDHFKEKIGRASCRERVWVKVVD